jgi:hypothetical protein
MRNFALLSLLLVITMFIAGCGGGGGGGSSTNSGTQAPPLGTDHNGNPIIGSAIDSGGNPIGPPVSNPAWPYAETNGATVSVSNGAIDNPVLASGTTARLTFNFAANTEFTGTLTILTLDNVGAPDNTQAERQRATYAITNVIAYYQQGGMSQSERNYFGGAYQKAPISFTGGINIKRAANGDLTANPYIYGNDANQWEVTSNLMGVFPGVFTSKDASGNTTADLTKPLEIRVHPCIGEYSKIPAPLLLSDGSHIPGQFCGTTVAIPVSVP